MLIREASEQFGWNINYGATALLWREGCIIRSRFLGNIRDAYEANPDLIFLGSDSYFKGILENALSDWRKVVAKSIEVGYPNALYGLCDYLLRWLYFSTFTGKTCCKHNVTTSVLILMSVPTNHVVNSSTPTGQVAVVTQHLPLMMCK